jgi:hypothetical protein
MKTWERKFYSVPGGQPALFYVLYGTFNASMPPMSQATYHSRGIPPGFDLMKYDRPEYSSVMEGFCSGYLWDSLLAENPLLTQTITEAQSCFILRGEIEDQPDLNYFRDAIGITTYLADAGGVAIFDPHMFKWWTIDEWRNKVFAEHEAHPRHHVVILVSDEPGGLWLHTRGMRKFGRPDLSMFNVTPDLKDGAVEMFNRFIEFQAFGGILEEGKEISMQGLPDGLFCHHAGDLEDPDFNNVHVEIRVT